MRDNISVFWVFLKGRVKLLKVWSFRRLEGPAGTHQLVNGIGTVLVWPLQPIVLVLNHIQYLQRYNQQVNCNIDTLAIPPKGTIGYTFNYTLASDKLMFTLPPPQFSRPYGLHVPFGLLGKCSEFSFSSFYDSSS